MSKGKHIIIDIGHARGTGARGNGMEEHARCEIIATFLAARLRNDGYAVTVLDYPDSTNSADLVATVKAANGISRAAFGISLHMDAAELWDDEGADGMPDEAKEAMRKLLERTKPEDGVEELQKAFDLDEAQAEEAMQALEEEGYEVPRGQVAEPWATAAAAVAAMGAVRAGMVRVLLKWRGPQSARNLQPLLRKLGREPEDALQLIEGHRLRVVDKKEHTTADGARVITYTVEENA